MRLLTLFTTAVLALAVDAASSLVLFNPVVVSKFSEVVIKTSLGTTATVYERVCPTATVVTAECVNYLFTQGASTWEYNESGTISSVHAACTFTGGPVPSGTGTCTLTATGPASLIVTSTSTLTGSIFEKSDVLNTVTVLTSEPSTATVTATATVTTVQTTGDHQHSNSSAAHSGTPTGRAGSLTAPTGAAAVMAAGGAAILLVAAVGT